MTVGLRQAGLRRCAAACAKRVPCGHAARARPCCPYRPGRPSRCASARNAQARVCVGWRKLTGGSRARPLGSQGRASEGSSHGFPRLRQGFGQCFQQGIGARGGRMCPKLGLLATRAGSGPRARGSRAALVKSCDWRLAFCLEPQVITWTKQVRYVLKQDRSSRLRGSWWGCGRVLKFGFEEPEHIFRQGSPQPDAELQFWRSRVGPSALGPSRLARP